MTESNTRLHGLDALRGSMMLLGIVLHAAFFHLLTAIAAGAAPAPLVLVIIGVIHQFRMPLFFLLAGFFMAQLVERRGPQAALLNRARRILLPLLLCLVSVLPVTYWLFFSIFQSALQAGLALVGPGTDMAALLGFMRERGLSAPLGLFHLWFLYYLFIFCTGAVVLAAPLRRLCARMPATLLAHPIFILFLSAVTALTLRPFPDAVAEVNDPLFVPSAAALAYHGFFFVCGHLLWQRRELQSAFMHHPRWYAVLAAMATIAFALLYFSPAWSAGGLHPLGRGLAALSTWGFIYWLCGLGLGRWNRDSQPTRLLAQSAYWIYLVHMPLILLIGLALEPLQLPLVAAMLVNIALTTALCLWTYQRWVRGSRLGALLNGRRYDRLGYTVDFRRSCGS